ncbi:MAG: AMP-binding protein, partial [Acidimicrobiia bacterium]
MSAAEHEWRSGPPTVLTSEGLAAAGNRFARMLDACGVPVRGGVALLAGNVPEFLATYRGTTWSGRRITPMSWRWSASDVAYVVDNCEADVLIVESRHVDLAAGAARSIDPSRRFAVGGSVPGFRDWAEIEHLAGGPIDHPLAGTTMMFTSGTTGRPKGVQRQPVDGPPPAQVGRSGMQMLQSGAADESDGRHLVCTPLYHSGPITYAEGAALLGSELVLIDRFDPEDVLRAIEQYRITSTFMVPTQFVRLLRLPEHVRDRYDLSTLRLVAHGSAPVAPDVKRAMIEWLGPVLYEFYGGTEGGGVAIDSRDWLAHPGSVGRPRPGLGMEIRDDSGVVVDAGVEGQIWFSDGRPFEYKDDAAKTAEAVSGEWFSLGDIGFVDDDGWLYLCDRRA